MKALGNPVQLNQKDLAPLREKLHKEQQGICPLLNQYFPVIKCVVDHQHRAKHEPIGEGGGGLIRGCIQFQANSMEGKIWNAWKRYGLSKFNITLPNFLRNLADYLERDNLPYIHPSEKPKAPKLSKKCYKELVQSLKGTKCKVPKYPSTGKLTKGLATLFEQQKIEVRYIK